MEFLMTYGWALLLIAFVVGALFYSGVLSVPSLLPDECDFLALVSCVDYEVAGNGISLLVRNGANRDLIIRNISASSEALSGSCGFSEGGRVVLRSGERRQVRLNSDGCGFRDTNDDKNSYGLNLSYSWRETPLVTENVIGQMVANEPCRSGNCSHVLLSVDASEQADQFIREVLNGAESVYALGFPSRAVLSQRLPDNVESMTISPNVMVRDPADRYVLRVGLDGVNARSSSTVVPIYGRFSEGDLSGGVKRVFVEAKRAPGGRSFVAVGIARPVSRVFLSSEDNTGDLGGLAGADGICARLANSEGFGGSWKAWLSNSTVSAKDRVRDGKYVLVYGGDVIANSKEDLTDGTIAVRINVTELSFRSDARVYNVKLGQGGNHDPDFDILTSVANYSSLNYNQFNDQGIPYLNKRYRGWTGTLEDGSAGSINCDDWTTNASNRSGVPGRWASTDFHWTNSQHNLECALLRPLYCFES